MESVSTTAIVRLVDTIPVGSKHFHFIVVEYCDNSARPDLAGQLSGWIRVNRLFTSGDIIPIAFTPKPDQTGRSYWAPFIPGRNI